ncbi:MAG: hypothetical protein NTW03_15100 [Verrucomicrobia bacterium]|nr:hypothetical protein [Verrucomicrobiota bacterium]
MGSSAAARSDQRGRAVVQHHARGFHAVITPLTGTAPDDEAGFGARQFVGVIQAKLRALAQAGGGGFFRRNKQADEERGFGLGGGGGWGGEA